MKTIVACLAAWPSLAWVAAAAHAGEPPATSLPTVTVVAIAPGIVDDVDTRGLSHAVQMLDRNALDHAAGGSLANALDGGATSIGLNDVQGNPWQPDLQYRGFVASPVLGTPQGLAAYQDGVRLNEVFGDTVDFDLVPSRAVESATLGSAAALFGRNALGGSINLQSKTGFTAPGTRLGYEGGSWQRSDAYIESGGHDGALGYYLFADRIHEAGWRDLSPSHLEHQTAVVSYRQPMTSVDLHLAHAATDLAGNGASPVALLDQRRSAIFTAPDLTQSRLAQVSASATHRWSEDTSLAGTIYSRRVRVASFNGDANEYEPCDDVPDMLCDDSGNPLRTMGGAATSNFNAIANLGTRWQRGTGASMAFRTVASLGGIEHQWLAGAEARRGALTYQSLQRLGTLDSRRYVDDTGPTVDAASVAVAARTKDWSFYLDDAMRLGEAWTLNLALRFNHSAVGISDRSGQNPALDGQHAFRRPEPSLGLAWAFTERASTYVSYAESTRVPTPMELTCANPDAPCRLPNDFISDPPLKQVVARSVEWGVRGSHGSSPWTVAAFRTTSAQDIAFQSTGGATSNRGFFANVGDTRRDGLEATLQRQLGAVRWRGSYTLLRAVYLSGFAEADENHPRAQDGVIHVQKGDQLPGLPRHNLKLDMDWSVANGFSLGLDGRYVSGQRLRGDESNQLPPISGYVLFDASTTWHPSPRWIWTLRIENLLDRKYASFGTLGEPSEVFPNSTTHASLALERPAPPTWRWSSSYSRRLGAARVALAE